MKDLILIFVTISILLVDYFVLQFYTKSIELLLQKKYREILWKKDYVIVRIVFVTLLSARTKHVRNVRGR